MRQYNVILSEEKAAQNYYLFWSMSKTHCFSPTESYLTSYLIQQIWTCANCLQVQVYLLNMGKSIKQRLRNHSGITAIIDKVKVCTFTPTVKLNSYVLLVQMFWLSFVRFSIYWLWDWQYPYIEHSRWSFNHLFLPLSILTATVLQVAVLSIPKASASMTWPKAPRPRGLPWSEKMNRLWFICLAQWSKDAE